MKIEKFLFAKKIRIYCNMLNLSEFLFAKKMQ